MAHFFFSLALFLWGFAGTPATGVSPFDAQGGTPHGRVAPITTPADTQGGIPIG